MIYCVSISVYDTTLPANANRPLEYAEKGSVLLSYGGSDNKFEPLMASTLDFSMDVDHDNLNSDLYYGHLFTGSETKYKVVMADQDSNVLWEGFLLPDQYSEPYTVGTFFVKFTATDGLGRLKGQKLPDTFYTARQSVVKVIADCLKKTGLELPIYIDPAILNDGAGKDWRKLYVNGSVWGNDSENANCYEILESVIKQMGCVLYQRESKWYVVGVNVRGQSSNYYLTYTADGAEDGFSLDVNEDTYMDWNASPIVSLRPPFKQVKVTTGVNESQEIFPEDLFTQTWEKTQEPQDPPPIKKWDFVGSGEAVLLPKTGLTFQEYSENDIEISAAVGFAQVGSIDASDIYDTYMVLKNPIYIKGGYSFDFKLILKYRFDDPNYGGFDFDTYINNNMWYEVLLDGTPIISNRSTFTGNETFRWSVTNKVTETEYLEYTLEVVANKLYIANSGNINFKVFNGETTVSGADNGGFILVDKIELKYRDAFPDSFIKTRAIDYTKTESVEITNGDSVLDNVPEAIVYQPDLPVETFVEYEFAPFFAYVGGDPLGWVASVTQTVYDAFTNPSHSMYVLRENSDFYEFINDVDFVEDGANNYILINFEDGHQITNIDKLFIRFNETANPQTTTVRNQRESWQKTTNSNGSDRLGNVLAEVYHDVYAVPQAVFEGTTKGLVFPGTKCTYRLGNNIKTFVPLRVEQTIGENETRVTLIEALNNRVTDYE